MIQKVTLNYHIPVMVHECIQGLNIKPKGTYIDVTYGGGGHSSEILKQLNGPGRLIAFDQDPDSIKELQDHPNLIFVNHNFQYLTNFLKFYEITGVDGILADLGISSHQIDEGERGFSFRFDAALDMRMGQDGTKSAAEIVNTYDAEQLSKLFKSYGEIRFAWKLAQKIVAKRKAEPIRTTFELAELAEEFIPPHKRNKELAQLFQALRIEVNDEMGSLRKLLSQCTDALNPGGRLVIMSYHSLEDRMVKNFIQSGNIRGETSFNEFGQIPSSLKSITRKPIVPGDQELISNPRSRSARLRIAEKL